MNVNSSLAPLYVGKGKLGIGNPAVKRGLKVVDSDHASSVSTNLEIEDEYGLLALARAMVLESGVFVSE